MKQFSVISLFPESLTSYMSASIIGRAQEKKLIRVNAIQLRDFAEGKHKITDESPFGGGPGMVLKAEPIWRAVAHAKKQGKTKKVRTILFSTRGKVFNGATARRLAQYDHLVLVCGRYEGVDERVATHLVDEEISLGDFVLSGGELPAMVLIDAVARQVKGVLGKTESLEEIKGSYPVYTKPAVIEVGVKKGAKKKLSVPKVLTSGNHKLIDEWRTTHRM
jgi:tRNA (guanine37-N1)-methyltransferase